MNIPTPPEGYTLVIDLQQIPNTKIPPGSLYQTQRDDEWHFSTGATENESFDTAGNEPYFYAIPKDRMNGLIPWRQEKTETQIPPTDLPSITPPRYNKTFQGVKIDPYRILVCYGITHPAHQHAIKKLLRAENDPHQSLSEDIDEVIGALTRMKEMITEDTSKNS
ncbi:hypothetical protein [Prosthecobacter sp.]|uniref:hypothetical protein n=1 Tax=Prosthecobacter sp. TaxID=1965333 RepID=UPI003783E002